MAISNRRKITTNIFFLTLNQGISWAFAAITIIIVPRYLGPANLGIFSLMTAISGLVTIIASFGTKTYILREVAANAEEAKRLVGPAMLMYALFTLLNWSVVAVVFCLTNTPTLTLIVMGITIVTNLITSTGSPIASALSGMDKMHYGFILTLINNGLFILFLGVIIGLDLGIIGIIAPNILFTSIGLFLAIRWFKKYSQIEFKNIFKTIKELIWGGFSFLVIDITFQIYLYLDIILLSTLTSETVVGYYSVPTRLFGSLLSAPVIICQAMLPTLSRLNNEKSPKANEYSQNIISILVSTSLPVAIGVTVMADPFIQFFYGSKFSPSMPVMIILGWTTFFTYVGVGMYQILVAQNKQAGWTKLNVMAVFLNCILNLILIPVFQNLNENGAIGAALSLLLTEMAIDLFGLGMISREILNRKLAGNVAKSVGLSLLMGLIIFPLRETWLFIPIILGVLVYGIGGIFLFGLKDQFVKYANEARQLVMRKLNRRQVASSPEKL